MHTSDCRFCIEEIDCSLQWFQTWAAFFDDSLMYLDTYSGVGNDVIWKKGQSHAGFDRRSDDVYLQVV